MRSKKWFLNLRDFIHGVVVAIISAIAAFLAGQLSAGQLFGVAMWKGCGMVALITFLSYLAKNLFQNSKGEFASEPTPPNSFDVQCPSAKLEIRSDGNVGIGT